jgi:tetratricopeptide (TPR) repeat protein
MEMSAAAPPDAENMGVGAAQVEFSRWGWAFRTQYVKDYGIDAHAEPFDDPHQPSGRLLALQIKSGDSYFREETADGWWYRGENRHLRYWLNHVLPVLIVIYDVNCSTLYWQQVTEDRVVYTDEGWKILIPRDQVVSVEAAEQLRAIVDAAPGASEDPVAKSLPLLPPSAAGVLRTAQAVEPDGTMRLARLLAQGREQPRLTVETVLAARPSWLPGANGRFEAAIGAYANEHGHQDLALEAFCRAAEYGSEEAGRLYGVAAVLALGQGDFERAAALVRSADDAGRQGLYLSVARAALADHEQGADVDSPGVAEVLAHATREDLAMEPALVVLLGGFAARRGDLAEALRLFEAAAAADPPLAVARLQLAHALLARAGEGSSVVAVNDRLRALNLAREVQDEVRRWSGPSEKALSVLLKTHMVIGAFHEVVRLATPESLGGTALDREASFGEVAVYGAEAARALRDRARAAGFADLVKDSRAEVYIRALAIDPSAPTADHASAWRAALSSADTFEQQRRAVYELAALGELQAADLAVGRSSRAVDDAQAEILSARNDAAQGRIDQAVMSLRRHAESNSGASEMLVEVLAGADRIDEALAECDRAISRYGFGKIAYDKLNILAAAGRLGEADEFATRLLAGRDLAPEQRVMLRRRLIQNRADQGQWSEVERMSREALAENPDYGDFRWGLITAQANQGHLDQAWSTYQAMKPPVSRPECVQLWMNLHARFGFSEVDVRTALDLVDRWPDNRDVGGVIFPAFLDLGGQHLPDGRPVLPDLDPETLTRFQAEVQSYARRYPDGPIQMIDLMDVDLTQVIRAQLVPHAGSLDHAAELVRAGKLPLGALAAAAARPYATMLIEQSGGALHAVTTDQEAFAGELAAAKEAINGEVVVEASTLTVITLLPERSPVLESAFSAIRLPRPALVDLDVAFGDLRRDPGFSFSVSYDAEREVFLRQEISLAEHQRLYRRITAVDQAARQLVVTDLETTEGPLDGHQAWLAAVDLAAERRLPLWSDDVPVRAIAASRAIATFGTWALLAALVEMGLIPDTIGEDALLLAGGGVVELPATGEVGPGVAAT